VSRFPAYGSRTPAEKQLKGDASHCAAYRTAGPDRERIARTQLELRYLPGLQGRGLFFILRSKNPAHLFGGPIASRFQVPGSRARARDYSGPAGDHHGCEGAHRARCCGAAFAHEGRAHRSPAKGWLRLAPLQTTRTRQDALTIVSAFGAFRHWPAIGVHWFDAIDPLRNSARTQSCKNKKKHLEALRRTARGLKSRVDSLPIRSPRRRAPAPRAARRYRAPWRS
jgi:hypothetical protein